MHVFVHAAVRAFNPAEALGSVSVHAERPVCVTGTVFTSRVFG